VVFRDLKEVWIEARFRANFCNWQCQDAKHEERKTNHKIWDCFDSNDENKGVEWERGVRYCEEVTEVIISHC
jgi:hypothetical protein